MPKPKTKVQGTAAKFVIKSVKPGKGKYLYCWFTAASSGAWVDDIKLTRVFTSKIAARKHAEELGIQKGDYSVVPL